MAGLCTFQAGFLAHADSVKAAWSRPTWLDLARMKLDEAVQRSCSIDLDR